jgi:hypothetical protein
MTSPWIPSEAPKVSLTVVDMAKLRIEVLRPRRVVIGRDEAGAPVFRTFTAEDCRRYAERGNQMLNSVAVPVCWGHRDDAKPVSLDAAKTDFARGTAGYVDRFVLDGGRAFAEADIPDESEARRAKNVRFASPEIEQFTDGTGRDWGEVVTHLALTPRPRQHDQEPITRLSFNPKRIRLAIDAEKGTDMADEKDDPKPEGDDKPKKTEGDTTEGMNYFSEAMEMLKAKGVNLPDDTTPENAWERIYVACMQNETPGDDSLLPPPTEEASPPMGAPISLGFQKQEKLATALAQKNLNSQISGLKNSGRITPEIEKKLKDRLVKVQLSFDKDGELKRNEVIVQVEAYAALPQWSAWKPSAGTRLANETTVEEAPANPLAMPRDGDFTPEQVDEIFVGWDAGIPGRTPQSK